MKRILGRSGDKKNKALHVSHGEIRFVLPRACVQDRISVQYLFTWQQENKEEGFRFNQCTNTPPDHIVLESTELKGKPRVQEGVSDHDLAKTVEEHCRQSLIRSVDDAMKDKVGRRPRANSTDHELNLPQHGLCDERIILQSHKWDTGRFYPPSHIVPPPRGFINLGNTCFLNATLQCLAYMPSFCQSITALPTSCYGGTHMHGQSITMSLRSLLRMAHGIAALERHKPPKKSPIAPKRIHKAITSCKINGHRFRPGRQEDAHELLVHLLDAMHEGELFAAGEVLNCQSVWM